MSKKKATPGAVRTTAPVNEMITKLMQREQKENPHMYVSKQYIVGKLVRDRYLEVFGE